MRPETAISLAMLSLADQQSSGQVGFRDDITKKLLHLRSKGIQLSGLRLRPSLEGGVSSDEVSAFVSKLAIAGYVVQESPITLTDAGLGLLRDHITSRSSDPDVLKAAQALNISSHAAQREASLT